MYPERSTSKVSDKRPVSGRRLILVLMIGVSVCLLVYACSEIIRGIPDSYHNDKLSSVALGLSLFCLFTATLFQDFSLHSNTNKPLYKVLYKVFMAFATVSSGFIIWLIFGTG